MSTTRRSYNERDKHLAETYGKLTKAVEELVRGEDWARCSPSRLATTATASATCASYSLSEATHRGSVAIELGRHSDAR